MKTGTNLFTELNNELRREKIIAFLKQHFIKIIAVVVVIIIIGGGFSFYNYLTEEKSKSNSILFAEVQDEFTAGKVENAVKLLDKLSKEGTNGYQFIAYMSKANIAIQKGDLKKAAKIVCTARDSVSLPRYYKEMLDTIEYMLRINSDEDINIIIKDLAKNLNEKDNFYFFQLEMYASALFVNQQYKESLSSYNQIINGENVPQDLQSRAMRAKGLLLGYIK